MSDGVRACAEFMGLSRRQFVGLGGSVLASLALRPAAFGQTQPQNIKLASDTGGGLERDALIVVFLRGGADGLSLVPPYAEDQYYTARPSLSVPRPAPGQTGTALDLNGFFGLHPALSALMPVYRAGHLALVHACGFDDTSRSHFDSQKWMELGRTGDNSLQNGWLTRHLESVAAFNVPIRAAAIGAGLPRSLLAGPKSFPFASLSALNMGGDPNTLASRLAAISDMYQQAEAELAASGASTVTVLNALLQIDFDNYKPCCGVSYSSTSFGFAIKSVAALLKYQPAIEAVTLDVTGWDTHANQGSQTPAGGMWKLMADLGQNLSSFYYDMTQGGAPYTLVVLSEFGRNIRQNGSRGTDHGHGGVMMAMGPGVRGGQVISQWPGLSPSNWFEGQDLPVTIDYRDILAEIIDRRMGSQAFASIFPGFTPVYRGVAVTR